MHGRKLEKKLLDSTETLSTAMADKWKHQSAKFLVRGELEGSRARVRSESSYRRIDVTLSLYLLAFVAGMTIRSATKIINNK